MVLMFGYINFINKRVILSLKEQYFFNVIHIPVVRRIQQFFEEYKTKREESEKRIWRLFQWQ